MATTRTPQFGPTIPQLAALATVDARPLEHSRGTSKTRGAIWNSLDALEKNINRLAIAGTPPSISLKTVEGAGRHRKTVLTAEGSALTAPAAEFLTALQKFRLACERVRSGSRHVAVGCFPAYAPQVALATRDLAEEGVPVQLNVSDYSRATRGADLVAAVAQCRLDLAVVPEQPVPPGLTRHILYLWHIRCVVSRSHELANQKKCELRDLRGQRVLASPIGHVTRALIEATGAVQVDFDNISVDALVALARSGWGVALVAEDCIPVRNGDPNPEAVWPLVCHDGQPLRGSVMAVTRADLKADDPVLGIVGRLKDLAKGYGSDRQPAEASSLDTIVDSISPEALSLPDSSKHGDLGGDI